MPRKRENSSSSSGTSDSDSDSSDTSSDYSSSEDSEDESNRVKDVSNRNASREHLGLGRSSGRPDSNTNNRRGHDIVGKNRNVKSSESRDDRVKSAVSRVRKRSGSDDQYERRKESGAASYNRRGPSPRRDRQRPRSDSPVMGRGDRFVGVSDRHRDRNSPVHREQQRFRSRSPIAGRQERGPRDSRRNRQSSRSPIHRSRSPLNRQEFRRDRSPEKKEQGRREENGADRRQDRRNERRQDKRKDSPVDRRQDRRKESPVDRRQDRRNESPADGRQERQRESPVSRRKERRNDSSTRRQDKSNDSPSTRRQNRRSSSPTSKRQDRRDVSPSSETDSRRNERQKSKSVSSPEDMTGSRKDKSPNNRESNRRKEDYGRHEKTFEKARLRSPVDRKEERRQSPKNRENSRSPGARRHSMSRFESEPESGEITDSDDEDDQGRQPPMRSTVQTISSRPEDSRKLDERRRPRRPDREDFRPEKQAHGDDRKQKENENGADSKQSDAPQGTTTSAVKAAGPDTGVAALTGRTGGAYIPPAKLRAMQAAITDKTSVAYQRISWEALKKSINGLINKVNVSNIIDIVKELFQENIVRGRGLMARSIIQAQAASPTFTHVYAALVSIINTKFPQNGELILKRLVIQFRRSFKRNDKPMCLSSTRFVAHLVNQQVAHEVLALEILTLLLENPSDDSVEVAIGFLKECGQKLTEVSPRGINAIFERLRNILHEGQIDTRVQYMVEVMFAIRKDGFKDHVAVVEDLDLVEEADQFTHLMTLEDATNAEDLLNVFRPDPDFQENEEKYKVLKKEILDESSDDESGGSGESGSDDDSEEEEEDEEGEKAQTIIDNTETNLVALRRTIYLTIQSSLDFEECTHKLLKMELKPGQEVELCNMILDCCAQMRTYEKFFGLLGQRFCQIDKKYIEPFQNMFKEQYDTIHRLESNKLRNVAKFFAHLLHTDAISWGVLSCIRLNEEDTTSASRIFIKILFQELSEYMGLPKLNNRLKDESLQMYFEGVLPRDNPKHTRFAINFFTTIGLGGLTDDLRDHLKNLSKQLMQQKEAEAAEAEEDSSSEESSSSEDEEEDTSDSSEEEEVVRKRKNKEKPTAKRKVRNGAIDESRQRKRARKNSTGSESDSDSESEEEDRSRTTKQRNEDSRKGQGQILDRKTDRRGNRRGGDNELPEKERFDGLRKGGEGKDRQRHSGRGDYHQVDSYTDPWARKKVDSRTLHEKETYKSRDSDRGRGRYRERPSEMEDRRERDYVNGRDGRRRR